MSRAAGVIFNLKRLYIYGVPALIHTDSNHLAFQQLSFLLERELYLRDGDLAEANFELNKIDFLPVVVLIVEDELPIACGAYRKYTDEVVEIKRMYVIPDHRRHKFASKILSELELLAKSDGYQYSLLETGKNQPEAISFYLKYGYKPIERFGKYRQNANSVCFKKSL